MGKVTGHHEGTNRLASGRRRLEAAECQGKHTDTGGSSFSGNKNKSETQRGWLHCNDRVAGTGDGCRRWAHKQLRTRPAHRQHKHSSTEIEKQIEATQGSELEKGAHKETYVLRLLFRHCWWYFGAAEALERSTRDTATSDLSFATDGGGRQDLLLRQRPLRLERSSSLFATADRSSAGGKSSAVLLVRREAKHVGAGKDSHIEEAVEDG